MHISATMCGCLFWCSTCSSKVYFGSEIWWFFAFRPFKISQCSKIHMDLFSWCRNQKVKIKIWWESGVPPIVVVQTDAAVGECDYFFVQGAYISAYQWQYNKGDIAMHQCNSLTYNRIWVSFEREELGVNYSSPKYNTLGLIYFYLPGHKNQRGIFLTSTFQIKMLSSFLCLYHWAGL